MQCINMIYAQTCPKHLIFIFSDLSQMKAQPDLVKKFQAYLSGIVLAAYELLLAVCFCSHWFLFSWLEMNT